MYDAGGWRDQTAPVSGRFRAVAEALGVARTRPLRWDLLTLQWKLLTRLCVLCALCRARLVPDAHHGLWYMAGVVGMCRTAV